VPANAGFIPCGSDFLLLLFRVAVCEACMPGKVFTLVSDPFQFNAGVSDIFISIMDGIGPVFLRNPFGFLAVVDFIMVQGSAPCIFANVLFPTQFVRICALLSYSYDGLMT
jgi:hypothetical protein